MYKERTIKDNRPKRSAIDEAANFLSYKARTRHEIEQRLVDKGYSEDEIETVLDKLKEYSYVDATQYAIQTINSAKNGVIKGKRAIEHNLRSKGIDEETLTNAICEITEEMELAKAISLCTTIIVKNKGLEHLKIKQKLWRKLTERGFDYEIISEAVRSVYKTEDY